MLFLFILLCEDTLPPLPELSNLTLPEPVITVRSKPNILNSNLFVGNFCGGEWELVYKFFKLKSYGEIKNEWDTTRIVAISSQLSLPLNNFYLNPGLDFYYHLRNEEYQLIQPYLEYAAITGGLVIFGELKNCLWKRKKDEQTGNLNIILDQIQSNPHLEISFIRTDSILQPQTFIRTHLDFLHLGIGFLFLKNFPSPAIEIKFLTPGIKNEIRIKSGVEKKTLTEYFDPELPFKFELPVPAETLKFGLTDGFKFQFYENVLTTLFSCKYYNARLTIDSCYNLILKDNVEELSFNVNLKNKIQFSKVTIFNSSGFGYNRFNPELPLLARYIIKDEIVINYKFLELISELNYQSDRSGVRNRLPQLLLINIQQEIKYKSFKIFFSIKNLTNIKRQIFDNYYLTGRQFAGGLGVELKF
uniref:TonB-dependent receptor n=1 Tax=candidate division WOR-3 bacterium TaxID=2052148 RepID=A0A7C4TCA8_UNCW3